MYFHNLSVFIISIFFPSLIFPYDSLKDILEHLYFEAINYFTCANQYHIYYSLTLFMRYFVILVAGINILFIHSISIFLHRALKALGEE